MINFFRKNRHQLLNENRFHKYLLYAFGEILLVMIGILFALQVNNWNEERKKLSKEKVVLESILNDIEQVEDHLTSRSISFKSDSIWFDYFSRNWDRVNIDSVAHVFSKNGYLASFHNLFLDFREFHPPIANLSMIMRDGSLSLIRNQKIKNRINTLIYTDLMWVRKNVDIELELQLSFKEKIMADEDPKVVRLLSSTEYELSQRFAGSDAYFEKTKYELEVITKIDYARNYLNLKARQRLFVKLFIKRLKNSLVDIKKLIRSELSQ